MRAKVLIAGASPGTRVASDEWREEAFGRLWDHLVVADALAPCDAIFCFGSRSRSVPATAAELFRCGVAPVIVVTGGGTVADGRCEADAYADALQVLGVPAEAIVVERFARHTGENVELGLAALRAVLDPQRVVAVSWAPGIRRAVATFARHHPELEVLAAPALPDDRPRWDANPVNVIDALGEWDRLEAYAARGLIAPVPRPLEVIEAAEHLRAGLTADRAPAAARHGARLLRTDPRAVPAAASSTG